MAEAKSVDDALKLEVSEDGMTQELSNSPENLNETKAQILEIPGVFDNGRNNADKGEGIRSKVIFLLITLIIFAFLICILCIKL